MLNKQTITIPLGLGVNTKTDEKLVEAGQFNLVCENASFKKVGDVSKRDGYTEQTKTYYNKADAAGAAGADYTLLSTPPTCLATLGKSTFLRGATGKYWYSHENAFIYNSTYPIPEAKLKSITLYTSPTTIDHSDTSYDSYENIVIAVGREGNKNGDLAGSINNASTMVLYDLETESRVVTNKITNTADLATFGFVRCGFTRVSGASYYYNVTVDSGSNLKIKIFNKYGQENATSYTIANIRTAGAVNIGGIAVCRSSDDTSFYILANTTTNNLGKFVAISGTTKTFETTFTTTASFMESMTAKVNGSLVNLAYETGRLIVLNANGTVGTADAAIAGLSVSSIAYDQDSVGVIFGGSSGSYSSWTGGVQSVENNNTELMSDKVTIGGTPFVIGKSSYGTNINNEASYFALGYAAGVGKSGQKALVRFASGNAISGDLDGYYTNIPARFAKISSSKCAIALPQFSGQVGTEVSYQLQLFFIEINQDYKSNSKAILGNNVHFQGGFLAEFDGVDLIENGFHTPPVIFPVLNVAAAGSLAGTYEYKLVAKYVDKNGQITRSPPSGEVSTGAIAAKSVGISLSATPFGIKPLSCSIEIYRTKAGGSTFYYVSEVAVNMYSAATISLYTDDIADSVIEGNAILYTSGNILANDPAPSCKHVFQGGNRLFLIGLEDENEFAYSKQKLFGECVNFSDFLRMRVDTAQYSTVGGLTAGGFMDGKIILFKKNSIFYSSGDGPNETGQGSFTAPELVSADTGCSEPRSVVLTPMGLMFKGEKGIYLLSRGLESNYIGSGVEEFNSYQVTSAVHVDKKNHVVFTLINSDTGLKAMLVFDYFTQQWSVSKGFRAIDSDLLDGEHIVLDSSTHSPHVQVTGQFLDNGTAYSEKVKTPWIKISGIQDFARIWSATILGKFKSAHTLSVKVYYDYATDYEEDFVISPLLTDSQYQYRIHLKKQKCESIQFEIQDLSQSGTGESMELAALTLEVGLRKGSMKLAASRKY